jgi:hypothetical protein
MPAKAKKSEVEIEGAMSDPAVRAVVESLERNLEFFMNNIGMLIKKYDDLLNAALPLNPKYAEAMQSEGAKEESPLLKRAASGAILPADEPPKEKKTKGEGKAEKADSKPKDSAQTDPPQGAEAEKEGGEADANDGEEEEDVEIEIEFPDNKNLLKQLRLLKRESYELSTTFDGIHDWIALNIPDMKDEDNMGVEIMGAVIEQASSLTDTLRSVYALELKYLSDRADMEKALMKFPISVTLKQQLEVNDGDTWDEIERSWRTLIRVCLILHSVLTKNMEKLRNPRSHGHTMVM